jgi:hypothetical protein
MDDIHKENIPSNVLEDAQKQLKDIIETLAPYTINLTPEQRRERLKLGDKSLAFNEKSFDYAKSNPILVPPYLDMSMFEIDMKDTLGLRVLLVTAQQLTMAIDDTMMIAGSEAYSASLTFYNAVKQAAKQNVPGAKAIYNELQERYPGRSAKKQEDE